MISTLDMNQKAEGMCWLAREGITIKSSLKQNFKEKVRIQAIEHGDRLNDRTNNMMI